MTRQRARVLDGDRGRSLSGGPGSRRRGIGRTTNSLPRSVRAAYGFAPDRHCWAICGSAASGSIRVSAGLASGQGLVLTVQHCVEDCILSVSSPGFDPNLDPIMVATTSQEKQCPGLNADVVTAIADITTTIAKVSEGLSGEAATDARDVEIARIESGCRDKTAGKHCEVVTLYGGASIPFTNTGDIPMSAWSSRRKPPPRRSAGTPTTTIFRVMPSTSPSFGSTQTSAPAVTPMHLKWRSNPLADAELVFVSGNPGETGRLWPTSMISYVRDIYLPWVLVTDAELRGRLLMFAAGGPENARISHDLIYEVENTYKDEWGELAALSTQGFIERLQAAEAELRSRAGADGLLSKEADPWAEIARAYDDYRTFFFAYRYLEEGAFRSKLFGHARSIVRAVEERSKPEADRLEGYSDADLPLVEEDLLAEIPVQPAIEEIVVSFWLSKAREFLTADDPLVKELLGRESPEALAHRLVAGTGLGDVAVRRRLYDGGREAVAASTDPLIVFVRGFEPAARRLAERYRRDVREVRLAALGRLAKARFASLALALPGRNRHAAPELWRRRGLDGAGRTQGGVLHRFCRPVRPGDRSRSLPSRSAMGSGAPGSCARHCLQCLVQQ